MDGLKAAIGRQIAQVERRVRGGWDLYAGERDEIRRAAAATAHLVARLGLGPFRELLNEGSGKPQLLLAFQTGGADVVLKIYGRRRPNEAAVQRLWSGRGVPVVPVLACGDEPVSWLLMPFIDGRPPALDASLTAEVAAAAAAAHAVYRPGTGLRLSLLDGVKVHLDRVVVALDRHGYPPPAGWSALAGRWYPAGRPTLLHGDLAPVNLIRTAAGRLLLLDTCGYTGPAEFDAARWAARVGGAGGAVAELEAWLRVETGLDAPTARRLLGLELLMEAGVRELVKQERGEDWRPRDDLTTRYLAASAELLGTA
jgi:Phosphotransferase enzyme family